MSGTKFQIKRTGIAGRQPNTTNSSNSAYIEVGELALNFTDGILYSSNGSTLIELGANVTNQTITGTLTANGSVGSNGQVLISNSTGIYWGDVGDIAQGEPGEGVPVGGTDNQVLIKSSNTDYDTEWSSNLSLNSLSLETSLEANGTIGNTGDVLISDGTKAYWDTPKVQTLFVGRRALGDVEIGFFKLLPVHTRTDVVNINI